MKTIIKNIFLTLCAAVFMASCNADGDTVYVEGLDGSELIATASDVVLSVDNSREVVLSLAWKNCTLLSSDENYPVTPGLLSTSMQVSATEDFASYTETATSNLSRAYTGTALNTIATSLGLAVDVSSPLYFRIAATSGDNIQPVYSNVCKVNVTPFKVDKTYLSVFNSAKTDVVAYLYSPEESGVYTGWMVATSWYNCWFMENDGTYWGNSPVDGHPFELSNASDAWNCWFADGTGQWFVTVDTKNSEWSAMLITNMMVNGESMKFDSGTGSYKYVITTASDGETVTLTADGLAYDKNTDTDASAAVSKTINYVVTDGVLSEADVATAITIGKAGTYTIAVSVNEKAEQILTITEGVEETEDPETPLPMELKMYDTGLETVLATLAKTSDGTYKATVSATQWLNFKIKDEENSIVYGSDPSDLYTLSSDEGQWNIWLGDDFTDGATVRITVDLSTKKWSYEVLSTAATTFPSELKVYDTAGTTVLATLASTAEGVYEGTLTGSAWLNFLVVDEVNGTWYGSDPSNQYTLSSASGHYNIWLNDDFTDGASITVKADLNTMTWSYTVN